MGPVCPSIMHVGSTHLQVFANLAFVGDGLCWPGLEPPKLRDPEPVEAGWRNEIFQGV
jgi:hypothetical protein